MRSKLLLLVFFASINAHCQENVDTSFNRIDIEKWVMALQKNLSRRESKLDGKRNKAIKGLQNIEEEISVKVSSASRTRTQDSGLSFAMDEEKLDVGNSIIAAGIKYIPGFDSLWSMLRFFGLNHSSPNIEAARLKLEAIASTLGQFESIENLIIDRSRRLADCLEHRLFARQLKKIRKRMNDCAKWAQQCRYLLSHPDGIANSVVRVVRNAKPFRDFMARNSLLASLFSISPGIDSTADTQAIPGLQTRKEVLEFVHNRAGSTYYDEVTPFERAAQSAQPQFHESKDRIINSALQYKYDIRELPDDRTPKFQGSTSFFKRFEYGINIQTRRVNNFFPVTTDLGLFLGYKLNESYVMGVGASYKVGLGRAWNNIKVTQEGAAVRGYVDWKIPSALRGRSRGDFFLSCNYELNRQNAANTQVQPGSSNGWHQSALIGVTSVVDINNVLFDRVRLQLLLDLLSFRQIPRGRPLVFRIGYNFKKNRL